MKLSDPPKRIDEHVQILERPGGTFVVIRYTWLTSEERNQEKATQLLKWIKVKGKYKVLSNPSYPGYDPPWTLPFLQRQEMLVEVNLAR